MHMYEANTAKHNQTDSNQRVQRIEPRYFSSFSIVLKILKHLSKHTSSRKASQMASLAFLNHASAKST